MWVVLISLVYLRNLDLLVHTKMFQNQSVWLDKDITGRTNDWNKSVKAYVWVNK